MLFIEWTFFVFILLLFIVNDWSLFVLVVYFWFDLIWLIDWLISLFHGNKQSFFFTVLTVNKGPTVNKYCRKIQKSTTFEHFAWLRDCHDWCTRSYTGWTFPSEWTRSLQTLPLDGVTYTIPMATTEGCLLASTNRGCTPTGVCSARHTQYQWQLLHSSQSSSFAAASTLRCTSSADRIPRHRLSTYGRSTGICCRWSDDV